ncbi:hypothetical protein V6Z12_D12G193900 [Gossypium hirsutum]
MRMASTKFNLSSSVGILTLSQQYLNGSPALCLPIPTGY